MLTTTLRPLADRILIKKDEPTTTSSGGIALVDVRLTPMERGVVVAVGPGKRLKSGNIESMSVAVGDIVLFGTYAGSTIKSEIGDLLTLREDDILAVEEKMWNIEEEAT